MICISICTCNVGEVWSLKGWQWRCIEQIILLFFSSLHFKFCNHINTIIYGIAVTSDFATGRKIEKSKFDFFLPQSFRFFLGPTWFQIQWMYGILPLWLFIVFCYLINLLKLYAKLGDICTSVRAWQKALNCPPLQTNRLMLSGNSHSFFLDCYEALNYILQSEAEFLTLQLVIYIYIYIYIYTRTQLF